MSSSARLNSIRIVMIETTHPGNIGSAARAMKTMGLSDLRLVRPKAFPNVQATALASGAGDVLANAQVCDSLDEAIADAELVVATSARARRIPWPCISAYDLSKAVQKEPLERPIAILFGREDRGLTNDELQRCNLHVTIPSNEEYGVLNAAAAVQVICYELRMAAIGEQLELGDTLSHRFAQPLPELPWDQPAATQQEQQHLQEHLERIMVKSGFLDPANPGQSVTRMRRLFRRARPDKLEASILRGLLAAIERQLPSND